MPVTVRKNSRGDSKIPGPHWDIVEKATGKVKGHSTTKAKAEASVRVRNEAIKKRNKRLR